jgi:N-acyl-phosphatidylethanolamine-hydrolysing phospholipase D
VQHWSARGLGDRFETLWGGWAVFAPDFRWYFSGDAGYSRDFADTRERFASRMDRGVLFDLALLPIGAYEPRWFMTEQHMNPVEAVRAHSELAARRSLGIHWGTFALTDEPLDQPPRDLAAARQAFGVPERAFFVLPVGGSWWPAGEPGTDGAKQ